jgi:hypothetical protein
VDGTLVQGLRQPREAGEGEFRTTNPLARKARKLASRLFDEPKCAAPPNEFSCISKEHRRGETQRQKSGVGFGFAGYNPDVLCLSCRSYWYAEMAAQALERLAAIEARTKATLPKEDGIDLSNPPQ